MPHKWCCERGRKRRGNRRIEFIKKKMLKYMQLKEDDSSLSPDVESPEVSSLSTSSSSSLADAQGQWRRSSRSSPTLISYTPLSPTPSSSSSRSSASSISTPVTPNPSVSSGSAAPWSTSSSEPLSISNRKKNSLTLLSSPSSCSPPSLESALLGLAKTAIAPSKILADPLEKLVERRNELMSKLIATVGSRRANNLFVNHVQQWHYLLVYAEEDASLGTKLRRVLEKYEHVTVAGPWEVRLGDQRLDVWQRLLESSTVVLVLLSRALLRDKVLGICFPGTLIRRDSVVPLFVEPLEEEEITPSLKPIIHRSGVRIYTKDWDAKSYLQTLHKAYTFDIHYDREVFLLDQLLEEIRNNDSYVCRCGNC